MSEFRVSSKAVSCSFVSFPTPRWPPQRAALCSCHHPLREGNLKNLFSLGRMHHHRWGAAESTSSSFGPLGLFGKAAPMLTSGVHREVIVKHHTQEGSTCVLVLFMTALCVRIYKQVRDSQCVVYMFAYAGQHICMCRSTFQVSNLCRQQSAADLDLFSQLKHEIIHFICPQHPKVRNVFNLDFPDSNHLAKTLTIVSGPDTVNLTYHNFFASKEKVTQVINRCICVAAVPL